MKDNFSSHSDLYAQYRPQYPTKCYKYLNSLVGHKKNAWDCGTGNGQVARELAKTFSQVFATDISQSQMDQAPEKANIIYSIQPAEKTNFEDNIFNLIVVAQAIHWFNFEKFYSEVRRTASDGAVLCIMGYGRISISSSIDLIIDEFYEHVIGRYWDRERKFVDEEYQTIPFPFDEIATPNFAMASNWTLDHLIGYLNTWSAVKKYVKSNNSNPLFSLEEKLNKHWMKEEIKTVRFPFLLRVGQL